MFKKSILCAAVAAFSLTTGTASAAVSADEAARLNKDLTPMGAERTGNADGTIPEWTGGITQALPGWPNRKNHRPNPHGDDQVLFTITAANMDQYADELTEGTKAMLKAYPDAFKMNVYPSRRTAAFPQSIYDATTENAVKANLINNGTSVENAWGGTPFPIPQSGVEVIWNHLLRYQGSLRTSLAQEAIIYNNGQRQQWTWDTVVAMPFYQDTPSANDKKAGVFAKFALTTTQPSRDAGEGFLAIDSLDTKNKPRKAWSYDPGERRVRRAPNLQYDTPDRAITVIDDYEIFNGSPGRYDWKLVGKKEIYVPYNNNELNSPHRSFAELTPQGYLNADHIRYELHRVWVVEGTVKEGQRHLYNKRVMFVDEDSWNIVASDKYDGNGDLWRISYYYPVVASEIPLTGAGFYTSVDLKNGGYLMTNLPAEGVGWAFNSKPPKASYFTAAAMRRRGR